jgi:hypothetical protein
VTTRKPKPPRQSPPPSSNEVTIDANQLATRLDAQLTTADDARQIGLSRLSTLRDARANVLARQRADLGANATGERVAALDAAVAAAHASAASLAGQAALAAPPPPASDGETVVHGVAHGAASGTKVSATDESGKSVASTTTTHGGKFVLRYKAKSEGPHRLELRIHDPRHVPRLHVDVTHPVHFVLVNLRA